MKKGLIYLLLWRSLCCQLGAFGLSEITKFLKTRMRTSLVGKLYSIKN
jgi:hypothetical protein